MNINYAFQYLPSRNNVAHEWFQVWDQKKLFILLLRKPQILEEYTILICYCKGCACKITGRMTFVKIPSTAFQYPQIPYISILLSAEASKPTYLSELSFSTLNVHTKLQILESFNITTYFYKGIANKSVH